MSREQNFGRVLARPAFFFQTLRRLLRRTACVSRALSHAIALSSRYIGVRPTMV
jgi:hypothetical protein